MYRGKHGEKTLKESNLFHSISCIHALWQMTIVTRLGGFLLFGQAFKAGDINYFSQIADIIGQFLKGVKIIHFSSEFFFGQLL